MSGALNRHRHIRALARAAVAILETEPQIDVAAAALLVGVSAKTVYVVWHEMHPERPPRGRRITEAMREAQRAPFATLCDVMLDHIPTCGGALAVEILSATVDDYGTVGDRRLWRALHRLLDTGRVQRRGQRCMRARYTKRTP